MRRRQLREVTLAGILVLLAAGCSGLATTIEALGKDQTNVCASVSTPYGSVTAVRANTPGIRVSATAGNCNVETAR